nr:hypothetical protein CFP56_68452 [Quercus suber]
MAKRSTKAEHACSTCECCGQVNKDMSISNIGMRQNQVDPEFETSESLVESSHSISIASLFPPYNSDTDASSEFDEVASRFSHLSLTVHSPFSHFLFSPPPTTNISIASLFPPTISDTESEESNQTPPRLSNSIDSIFPPARSSPYRSDTVLVTSINDVNHFYQAGTTARVTPTNLTTSPSLTAGENLLPSGDLYTGSGNGTSKMGMSVTFGIMVTSI